jgi:hypothetical protein
MRRPRRRSGGLVAGCRDPRCWCGRRGLTCFGGGRRWSGSCRGCRLRLRGLPCPGGGLRLTFHPRRRAGRAGLISRSSRRGARRRRCAVAAIGRGSSFRHRRLSVRLPSMFSEMVTLCQASRPTLSPHPQIGLRPDSCALQVSAEQIWRTGAGVTGAHPACGEIPVRH